MLFTQYIWWGSFICHRRREASQRATTGASNTRLTCCGKHIEVTSFLSPFILAVVIFQDFQVYIFVSGQECSNTNVCALFCLSIRLLMKTHIPTISFFPLENFLLVWPGNFELKKCMLNFLWSSLLCYFNLFSGPGLHTHGCIFF